MPVLVRRLCVRFGEIFAVTADARLGTGIIT
jgi:hypothetical protein